MGPCWVLRWLTAESQNPRLPRQECQAPPWGLVSYSFYGTVLKNLNMTFYLKSIVSPAWGSYTKTKHNPKGFFLTPDVGVGTKG